MSLRLSRLAATGLAAVLCLAAIPFRALGDEGMFLPDTLSRLSQQQLMRRGLKIPLTEIYNPTGISIKDAVVIVDGGTGEFVSPDGLLLTNHHVGFDALVSASDATRDYATNGYKANSRADELPAKDYTVTITQDLKDVTSEILKGVTDSTPPADRERSIAQNVEQMELSGSNVAAGITVRVLPMNEGLSYYKFTYLLLSDVRIVYAPPKNIGFFGGDPDNFEWPRHCGDFTFMRVYVGPDGKPVPYSTANVPYKPRKVLPLSLAGVKPGDFMMVMGYPGATRRYRESYSVAYNQDIVLPLTIDIFTKQIESLKEAGKNDPARAIKLQSTIANIANSLKDDEGSVLALGRADIVGRKRKQEAALTRWLEADPGRKSKYGEVLPNLSRAYQTLNATALQDLLLLQLAQSSELLTIAFGVQDIAAARERPGGESAQQLAEAVVSARERAKAALADRDSTVERKLLTYLLRRAAELPEGQRIEPVEKRFGNLQGDARRRAEEDFARAIVDSKNFVTPETVGRLYDLSLTQLRELHEPFLDFVADLTPMVIQEQIRTTVFNETVSRWRPRLVQGMSEMNGTKPYPDADRSLRFTYGEVKGYVPHDAATYQAFSHLSGVIEKDTGREPFDVPAKLKDLYRTHDFGQYATPDGSDVPVNFLSNNDIIGGNSGSPIMNGMGEQVGIIFDGNYEGLGNDFFYNEEKGRAISVDIRYVLFIADKLGGAGYLLKELRLVGVPKARAAAARKSNH
jgi:hypothetical protein